VAQLGEDLLQQTGVAAKKTDNCATYPAGRRIRMDG